MTTTADNKVVENSKPNAKKATAAKKTNSKKSRKSRVARVIWKQRTRIMKTVIFAVLAVALYIVLGQKIAFANNTALVITMLGQFGALTYKGIAAIATFVGLSKNYG